MKTLRRFLLALLLSPPAAALACRQGPETQLNLLTNDSFETDAAGDAVPDGWSLGPGIVRVATFSHTGAASLAAGGAVSIVATQNLTLLPNTIYTLAGHVRSQGVTGNGVRFRYVENLPASQTHETAFATGGAAWVSAWTIFTTAGNHGGGRLEIEVDISGGQVWIDDVSICRGGDPCSRPRVFSFEPAEGARGVPRAGAVRVTLSESVPAASFSSSFTFEEITGPDDPAANAFPSGPKPAGAIAPAFSSGSFTFTPTAPLKSRTWYRMFVESFLQDLDGENQLRDFDSCFETAMDHTAAQTIVDSTRAVTVELPALALSSDARVAVSTAVPAERVLAANRKLAYHAGEPGRAPVPGALLDVSIYDDAGRRVTSLLKPGTLTLSYTDADNNGWVDGTTPPIAARTLALYALDEDRQVWEKIFGSAVDTQTKRVSAQTSHFSVFALMGQLDTDLSAVAVFPLPFRPSQGHTHITFANIGQGARIKIYSTSGELVRDIAAPVGASSYEWDVTNDRGAPVASGVYYYVLESGDNSKKGKVMVVR